MDNEGNSIPAGMVPLINVLKIIPISTSEDERGFSAMNLVCTNIRNRLNIESLSAILFIKINGPPIDQFSPDKYVKKWLRTHNAANSTLNTGRESESTKILKKKCWNLM